MCLMVHTARGEVNRRRVDALNGWLAPAEPGRLYIAVDRFQFPAVEGALEPTDGRVPSGTGLGTWSWGVRASVVAAFSQHSCSLV